MKRRTVCAGLVGGLTLPYSLMAAAMPNQAINPNAHSYAQAQLVKTPARLLFISGQIPVDVDQRVPKTFAEQCRLTWRNVEAQLQAAGMTLANLVKVTVFLSDRQYRAANAAVRKEVLGAHAPALTIIITGIYDEEWLIVPDLPSASCSRHVEANSVRRIGNSTGRKRRLDGTDTDEYPAAMDASRDILARL